MELLADRDPEEARKLLDPVLERMMEAVHRYEGTVNQVMGDGIMALFGAPLAHEDHAVRACYAALDMQTALHRYAEEVRRTHGLGGVAIRAGLNSGEVVVRAIGSDLRMDYTAVGQTTHLAARMEQLASPGTTLLTAGTLRLAEGFIAVKPLGPIPVKGLEAPVEVYEMTGAGAMRSRLHAAAARGLTRFVGRDSELEQLRQALGHAAAGHGQVVAIVGEPGVGKSRLVWEVTHSHRVHGWLVVQAGSVSYGKATSYLPVIDLLNVASLPAAYSAVGYVHLHRGEFVEALVPLTRAVEVGKATELLNWGTTSRGLLGLRDVRSGSVREGVAGVERAISLAKERGERFLLPLFESWLGEAHPHRETGTGRGGLARRVSRWRALSNSGGPRRGRGGFSATSLPRLPRLASRRPKPPTERR
jgi:class 3 adenylate cyclase